MELINSVFPGLVNDVSTLDSIWGLFVLWLNWISAKMLWLPLNIFFPPRRMINAIPGLFEMAQKKKPNPSILQIIGKTIIFIEPSYKKKATVYIRFSAVHWKYCMLCNKPKKIATFQSDSAKVLWQRHGAFQSLLILQSLSVAHLSVDSPSSGAP